MRTPTTDDFLHREAVDLCTDLASLLLRHRGAVRPEDAYGAAMECVRIAGHLLGARDASLPEESAARYRDARTSVQRVLVALDRAGARCPFPAEEIGGLERRFHELAQALGALGGAGPA
jgi:hypothetical protein